MKVFQVSIKENELNILLDAIDILEERIEKHNRLAIANQKDLSDIRELKIRLKDLTEQKTEAISEEKTIPIFQEGFNVIGEETNNFENTTDGQLFENSLNPLRSFCP